MADFAGILGRLVDHNVEFAVVGGYAAIAHGSAMMTQDVDICLHFSVDNLIRLQAALEALHPVHRMTPRRIPLTLTADTCAGLQNLYLDTDLGQLDCLSSIKGVGDYPVVFAQSIEVPLARGSCRVLSLDALIEAKSAMGRERDKEVVLQLRALRDRKSS